MKQKIVMFGSYVIDLMSRAGHLPTPGETVFGSSFTMGPGGKGSNQAVAAKRAGADIKVITKLGNDAFGNIALNFYKQEGIATDSVIIDSSTSTGTALICVDEITGQNQILVVPGACTNFTDSDIDRISDIICDADMLLVQFEVNLDALKKVMQIAKKAGVKIVLNPAPACCDDIEIIKMADLITPNEVEAETITGISVTDEISAKNAARAFHSMGIPDVIITMGSRGSFISSNGRSEFIPSLKVSAVDTTGAGDAFNGGVVTALSEGHDLFYAARFGTATAALSVTKKGTALAMPTREEIDNLFKS